VAHLADDIAGFDRRVLGEAKALIDEANCRSMQISCLPEGVL
jgi:hypothetical protein